MTDNELIAEFMGFELIVQDKWMTRYTTGLLDPYFGQFRSVHMRFNYSWDWLMPVVEKIEEMLYQVNIHTAFTNINGTCNSVVYNQDFCFEAQTDTKLSVTYRAVAAFIKWYNGVTGEVNSWSTKK